MINLWTLSTEPVVTETLIQSGTQREREVFVEGEEETRKAQKNREK